MKTACKHTNPKTQIANKSQIRTILKISNSLHGFVFGVCIWYFEFIWNLVFVIWDFLDELRCEPGRDFLATPYC